MIEVFESICKDYSWFNDQEQYEINLGRFRRGFMAAYNTLQSQLDAAEKRLSVAVKLDATDKDSFDWKVLDRIHDLDLQLTTAQEENKEIQYGFNIQAKAYINLMEENKRLQDAYNTLEFISKYDGKDNNRRSMYEEFIFIKVKAMDCIDRIKKSKSVPNGENDE